MVLKLQVGVQDIIGLSPSLGNGFIWISIKVYHLDGMGLMLMYGVWMTLLLTKPNCETKSSPPHYNDRTLEEQGYNGRMLAKKNDY
jgi:hypothetical protein